VTLAARIHDLGSQTPADSEQAGMMARQLEEALPAGWSLSALRQQARTVRGESLDSRLRQMEQGRQAIGREVSEKFAELSGSRMRSDDVSHLENSNGQDGGTATVAAVALAASAEALLADVAAGQRAVSQGQGRIEQELEQASQRLEGRTELLRRYRAAREAASQHQTHSQELWGQVCPILGEQSEALPDSIVLQPRLDALRADRALRDLDAARQERERLLGQQGDLGAREKRAREDAQERRHNVRELVARLGIESSSEVDRSALVTLLPDLESAWEDPTEHLPQLEGRRIEILGTKTSEERTATDLENRLRLNRTTLDEAACRVEVETLRHCKNVCERAVTILDRTRENVLNTVLPNTLGYMRLLLPLLTAGRYHDAQLDPESYKIEVWDNQVQEFVEKDVFSGATQDQFSLSLRLGFALAALPQERGVRPGFLFLDEPVAGFDGQRRDALLNLLSAGELAEYFPQVFFAAPSGVFDRNPLGYILRLENGRVTESTLAV
jgi:hypothetical protein